MSAQEFERFVIHIYGVIQNLPIKERLAILAEVQRRITNTEVF